MMGLKLLSARKFGPLFLTQFLGAFNDNLYRTAMLFLIAYQIFPGDAVAAGTWALVAGGVFVLPYFAFSSLAGELADRVDRARLVRIFRAIDIAIMGVAALALLFDSLYFLLLVLFATGIRSVFFGPLKYSILPQHLESEELVAGTGLLQTSSFIAILLGQVAGGLLPYHVTAWTLIAIAFGSWIAALAIPAAPPARPDFPIGRNLATGMARLVKSAIEQRELFAAILGISWFYALGALFTSQFPALVANIINAPEDVGAIFLAAFTTGIAAGAAGVAGLLKGRISAKFVPISALLMGLFTVDLWLATAGWSSGPERISVAAFLGMPSAWRLLFDLFAIAASGAVFAMPLYAVLQTSGDPNRRARNIAANNLANAATVVVAAIFAGALYALGGSIPTLFLALGAATFGVAFVAWRNPGGVLSAAGMTGDVATRKS